jgi:hypothetical protein
MERSQRHPLVLRLMDYCNLWKVSRFETFGSFEKLK